MRRWYNDPLRRNVFPRPRFRVEVSQVEQSEREVTEHRAWWTVRELADHYRVSVRTIYAEIETGRLVAHRFGGVRGAIRVSDEDRTKWEASSRTRSGEDSARQSFRLNSESARL